MGTFTAFFVGMLVGATVGMFFLAAVVVARDAEERANKIYERSHEDE